MYLKALSMQGFKSFPDPTRIEFHKGITAIVGPNGSGKSNITDAIRWVLGEQSAKTLRGSRMEDVIFSGTETRRQLGYAEVSIVFDNQDQVLPLDFAEVEITRRYYRSGDSQYLINKTECRLRDIHQLFLDTGIGRDGYSIIGQGQIEQILSDNSEDRRKVFDEAAGIVKYKLRKKETVKKLERTENNLVRIQDILNELEQRVGPLAKQAEKLKVYNSLQQELQQVDLALLLYDINRNQLELDKVQEAKQDLDQDLAEAQSTADNLKANYHRYDQSLAEIDAKLEETRLKETEVRADLAQVTEEKAVNQERQRSTTDQLKADEARLARESLGQESTSQDLAQREADQQKLSEELADLEKVYNQADRDLLTLKTEISGLKNKSEASRKSLTEGRDKLFHLEASKQKISQDLTYLADQSLQLSEDKAKLEKSLEAETKLESDVAQDLTRKQADFKEAGQALEEARAAVEAKRQELAELDDLGRQVAGKINNCQYQLETLERLEANREGFHQAVRSVMLKVDQDADFGQGIHGPLAELIKVGDQGEKAIEVSLGQALHNIVTETKEDASRLINWLKKTKSGRETFLPLDNISGRTMPGQDLAKVKNMPGLVGLAADQVVCDPIYQPIIDQLLGRILLAENLASALEISERLDRRYRIVSLDGDVVQPGGSMTGGENKKAGPRLLHRKREIEKGQTELAKLEKQAEDLVRQKAAAEKSFLKFAEEQKELESNNLLAERAIYRLEQELKQSRSNLDKVRRELEDKSKQIDRLAENRAGFEAKLQAVTEQLESGQDDLTKMSDFSGDLTKQLEAAEGKLTDQQNHVLELKVEVKTKQQVLAGLSEQLRQTTQAKAERERTIKDLESGIKLKQVELRELSVKADRYAENQVSLSEKLADLAKLLQEKQADRSAVEQEQHQLFAETEDQIRLVSDLQIRLDRAKQKIEKLDQGIASSKNAIWENYQLTYVSLRQEDYPLDNIKTSRDRLKALREEIKNLGMINPNALSEYEEVSKRFDFMTLQKEDIEKSKANLSQVISELEEAMSKQFRENFSQINQNFKEVFSALFIGGEAELALEGSDALNAGIQIKAQPPGKRLQGLNLLSGGEKALTAIALLLAIFRLRPAPFCILDEVESALDEANIIRFTDYLNAYTDYSQFVLVTHRKGTMEAADRLYGITMKERGVSKVLSLELTDADRVTDDGQIA